MKQKSRFCTARRILIFWTLFIGLGAVAGALAMLLDPSGKSMGMDAMLPYFQVLPFADVVFQDFTFSGWALLIVNGLTNLTAAGLLLAKKHSGVVLGGKLLTGYTGAAAEPGHMVILDTPDAPRCTCGRPGCLESLASATALIRMTKEAMAAHPESALHGIAAQSGGVNGRTAFDAAAQGDAAGKAVVEQYIHYLAVGVANMINIFFPEVIGLSGGVANQGENLLAPLRAAVGPMVFGNAYAQKHTRITTCTLGYRAGVIGAALLAKNQG